MTAQINADAGAIDLEALRQVWQGPVTLTLDEPARSRIREGQRAVTEALAGDRPIYGINTGFGLLANVRIPADRLVQLQENLILSHCAGVGAPLPDRVVRLVLVLKVLSLAQGYSGVTPELVDALCRLVNHEIYPVLPSQGSVGASGDLAPLAHLGAVLLGVGRARHAGVEHGAAEALRLAGLGRFTLQPKEGLALLNGTQVSTALALGALFQAESVFAAACVAGALSVDAARGSDTPFDARISRVRGHRGQSDVAALFRDLIAGSGIRASHAACDRVQDPYSLRCQPQVMGACLETLRHVGQVFLAEARAVTDNPLVFSADGVILSGGNFHAEPVALACDYLATAIAEIGALSERRIALLIDPRMSGLPPFLVEESGAQLGIHGAAGHRGGACLGEQVPRAPGERRQPAYLREPGGSRQHGDRRGAAPAPHDGQHVGNRCHRTARCGPGHRVPPATAQLRGARRDARGHPRRQPALRARPPARRGHRGGAGDDACRPLPAACHVVRLSHGHVPVSYRVHPPPGEHPARGDVHAAGARRPT